MKKIIFILLVLQATIPSIAQNIGIGTTTPNASAALHINSITKGFLPPSMTSTQRNNISSPAEGLMVYDNTLNRLYQYQGGAWKTILSNDYWSLNGTDLYSNSTLNVGIGNANPQEKLHVSGNIRTTGDLIMSGEITMNNATGTLQFQNASVNKGYIQISGDNLRMGTNSGNSTGNLVIRMNGNDRIQVNSSGDIDLDGEINKTTVTGNANLLPLCYGLIESDGSILISTGNFSMQRLQAGYYRLTCSGISPSTTVVVAMGLAGNSRVSGGSFVNNEIDFFVKDAASNNLADGAFYFIVYKL